MSISFKGKSVICYPSIHSSWDKNLKRFRSISLTVEDMFISDFTVENRRHIQDFHRLAGKQDLSNIQCILLTISKDQAKENNYLI